MQKSTAAALDFAAVTAMACRVFANDPSDELKAFSAVCLEASAKAMKWAEANPDIIYVQPKDISTGAYGDDNLTDELFWAQGRDWPCQRELFPGLDFLTGIKCRHPHMEPVGNTRTDLPGACRQMILSAHLREEAKSSACGICR
ncbi:MAG: glycoside hydrolase family 9 protein [Marinilabiliales bacterium]|nr:glycoside hydrolase family 9 protein [Marinilabiliales bacterium]